MALILTQVQVRSLLPMDRCVELVAEALSSLARDEATNPLRWAVHLPADRGLLGMMPGYVAAPPALGMKALAVFPRNHGTEFDSHQGVVLLFNIDNGTPIAILEASAITAIRTAAASGVATDLLARQDAGDVAILGSGVQARSHLEAMLLQREVRRVRVYSPTEEHRMRFAEEESKRHGIDVEPAPSAQSAVAEADIICTTTSSRKPVLRGEWLAAGAHVNAVGACVPSARELDTAAVVGARLFVDRRESALNEAGDFLVPKSEGVIGDDHIKGEIGELLTGQAKGRSNRQEITIFKSLGIAVMDLVSAHYVVAAAREKGVGTDIELGGFRHATD